MYVYIYIERERDVCIKKERERERGRERHDRPLPAQGPRAPRRRRPGSPGGAPAGKEVRNSNIIYLIYYIIIN